MTHRVHIYANVRVTLDGPGPTPDEDNVDFGTRAAEAVAAQPEAWLTAGVGHVVGGGAFTVAEVGFDESVSGVLVDELNDEEVVIAQTYLDDLLEEVDVMDAPETARHVRAMNFIRSIAGLPKGSNTGLDGIISRAEVFVQEYDALAAQTDEEPEQQAA